MDDWNFNAPVYQNFKAEDTNDADGLKDGSEDPVKKEASLQEAKIESLPLENMEVEENTRPDRATFKVPPENMEIEENTRPDRATFRLPNKTPPKRNSRTPNQPVRQSPRLAAIAKSIRRSNASRGLISINSSGEGSGRRRSLSEGSSIVTHFTKVKKHTVQRKVAVVRPKMSEVQSTTIMTQEDFTNLEETTKIKKALFANRQRTSNAPRGPFKAGPLKPTKPIEFNFATDSRTRTKPDAPDDCLIDFQKSLRAGTSVSNDQPKGPTKVQPFNLHNSTKPKEATEPFMSMAELNLKFHTKTPQRFRTKPSNCNMPIFEDSKRPHNQGGGVTQPKTPRLTTRARARSVDYPTREEIEEKEFKEAQKNQFKAKPLNKKILAEPDTKKLHESSKNITVPEPFDITDTRNESIKNSSRTLGESCKGSLSTSSSSSLSQGSIYSVWEKKRTEVKPFSFNSRDLEMISKKKEKIQKMIDEEKKLAEFHAQPMPLLDTVKGVPPKKPPTPTKLQPFKMHIDVRGSAKQQSLQAELEALERQEKEQRIFKAQPDAVLHKEPFVPEPSKKPLTDISGFSLNTDKRAEERHAFDLHLKEREDKLQEEKRLMEERKKKEEEEQVRELRKNIVHKAQPVRHYKPLQIKQGLLPPTIPVTPKLSIDQRLKTRALSKQILISSADSTINDTTAFVESGDSDTTAFVESGDSDITACVEGGDLDIKACVEGGDLDITACVEGGDSDITACVEGGDLDITFTM